MFDDSTSKYAVLKQSLIDYVLNLIGRIPSSQETQLEQPAARIRTISNSATINAALTSGALALPPGPFGWLTVLPDVVAIWRIQAQLVADIAALNGKSHLLTRENMLYCLFRHSATQAVRELVVQVGERFLVARLSLKMIKPVIERIGVRLSERLLGEAISRWLPIIGAVGVGAVAYYDTVEVARTAKQLFEREISIEPEQSTRSSHVSFKALNGLYVCSELGKDAILVADRAENLDWERFKIVPVDATEKTVGLLAANQCFWCCDGDRGLQLFANREKLELWETFTMETAGDGAVTLRAHNGRLVFVDAERGQTLWADRDVSGPETVFNVVNVPADNAE